METRIIITNINIILPTVFSTKLKIKNIHYLRLCKKVLFWVLGPRYFGPNESTIYVLWLWVFVKGEGPSKQETGQCVVMYYYRTYCTVQHNLWYSTNEDLWMSRRGGRKFGENYHVILFIREFMYQNVIIYIKKPFNNQCQQESTHNEPFSQLKWQILGPNTRFLGQEALLYVLAPVCFASLGRVCQIWG